jgi:thiol-disulfide isomerase/thioredoxin
MRFRTALAFATVALIAAAAGGFYYSSQPSAQQLAATRGQPFARPAAPKAIPPLEFEDDAGRAHTLADFKGKLVLLNLWATWCGPCREEMPALDRLQAELGGPRFEVLALSVDHQGLQIARKFFADVGVKSLALYIDRSAQATFRLGAVGLPSTLLVDAHGREIGRHVGPAKWDSPQVIAEFRQRIEALEH